MADKIIYITLIIISLVCNADCFAEKSDFRNVNWGMTRIEVMASEDIAPESFALDYMFFKPEIEGRKFHLIYEFVENRLTDAEYVFISYNKTDYLWLKNLVEIKYGRPFFSFDGGVNNYKYMWKNNFTEIILKPGQTRECRVEYTGKKFQYLKKERARKLSLTKISDVKNTF